MAACFFCRKRVIAQVLSAIHPTDSEHYSTGKQICATDLFCVMRSSKPFSRMEGMWAASSCCSTMDMRGFLVGVSKYCCHRSYSTDSRFCIMSNIWCSADCKCSTSGCSQFENGIPGRCVQALLSRADCTPSFLCTKHVHAVEQLSVALCSNKS